MNAYSDARAAGLRLDRVLPDSFQVRDGGKVLAVVHRSERGSSAWINPAHDAGRSRIARDPNGWQYIGRAATLRGIVARVIAVSQRTQDD